MPTPTKAAASGEFPGPSRHLFVTWLLATFAGWMLGIVFILTAASAGDMIGLGGSQFMLGAGMGAGVGYMQGRIIGHWAGSGGPWLWATVIGLGAPFLVADLLARTWAWLPFSMPLAVLAGGVLAGFMQRHVLVEYRRVSGWWVAASVAGWALAAGTAFLSSLLIRYLSGFYGAAVNLLLILLGGVVLGASTGAGLMWVLKRRAG